MRAFIFSLDAFVAFTLALVAIYSLIFFSSVPSSYYYLLTQGHFLTRDVLMSLSTAPCTDDYGVSCTNYEGTLLENIASEDEEAVAEALVKNTVGEMIPEQFGYAVELSRDHGSTWDLVYDTAGGGGSEEHAKEARKLTVSSQVIAFDYAGDVNRLKVSPYNYLSCGALAYGSPQEAEEAGYVDFGLITCGMWYMYVEGDIVPVVRGNTHPSEMLGGDLVPSSDVSIVKLTVYI
ncbi:hypothetical protein GF318_03025 [Candidatus Micrarchaeota archaeon]|nr:hypothetical protein [Candidatus Micrarchaeota archaeon]